MEEQKQAEQQWNKIRQERINILKEAPSEENLWQAVMAFQDYPFKTVTGLPFQYTLKTGKNGEWTKELWIDRREKSKSLSWSSVVLAFKNSRKTTEIVKRPKALGDIRGISYIYPILWRLGLIRVPEKFEEKMACDDEKNVYPEWVAGSNGTIELQVVDRVLAGENPVNGYSAMKQLVEGVLAGVILCLAIAALYAQLIRTVRKESDMKKITSKGCISLIPEIAVKKREKSKKQQLLLTNKRVDWGFKQSVQAAQLRIEKQMEQEHKQVLLVSSTLPQEGKSMTAVNLALAFMQHEKKTVLIDGDLRKPSVAEMLGMEEQKGLAEYLKGNAKVKEVLQKKGDLTVIPGGKVHGNISSLMDESRMEELMAFLKSEFDYVIIDTPPAYLFSDAAILAGYADRVLYVVRHDMAEIPQIEKGMESFIQEDKLLGYLINRSQKGFASYGKYGYGKYGYGKYGYGKYGKYQRYVDVKEDDMDTEDSL